MIPQCNPLAGYVAHKKEINSAISRVLESGWYILGKEVEAFEREFSDWLGVTHSIAVASGTDAIELALRACGIGQGDVVATVSHTAVATVSAISRVGATPVFADIGEDYLMSPSSLLEILEDKYTPKPKAIIVVHLYGAMAEMPIILKIARDYNLVVVEDCAQAHGASLLGKKSGGWGDVGCFSFYPTKNLGALGDGGAVVTQSDEIACRLRMLRQYGWRKRYISDEVGVNSRLDELQAAVLRVKLKYLDTDNEKRHIIAALYRKGLKDTPLVLPKAYSGSGHVYHQFVIQSNVRDALAKKLKTAGVETAIHYPAAIHQQPAYSRKSYCPIALSITEKIIPYILSLPIFPGMTDLEAEKVLDAILDVLSGGGISEI